MEGCDGVMIIYDGSSISPSSPDSLKTPSKRMSKCT